MSKYWSIINARDPNLTRHQLLIRKEAKSQEVNNAGELKKLS